MEAEFQWRMENVLAQLHTPGSAQDMLEWRARIRLEMWEDATEDWYSCQGKVLPTPEQRFGDRVRLRLHLLGGQPTAGGIAELTELVKREAELEDLYQALYWFADRRQSWTGMHHSPEGENFGGPGLLWEAFEERVAFGSPEGYRFWDIRDKRWEMLQPSEALALEPDLHWLVCQEWDLEMDYLALFESGPLPYSESADLIDWTPKDVGAGGVDGTTVSTPGVQDCWAIGPDPQPPGMGTSTTLLFSHQQTQDSADLIDLISEDVGAGGVDGIVLSTPGVQDCWAIGPDPQPPGMGTSSTLPFDQQWDTEILWRMQNVLAHLDVPASAQDEFRGGDKLMPQQDECLGDAAIGSSPQQQTSVLGGGTVSLTPQQPSCIQDGEHDLFSQLQVPEGMDLIDLPAEDEQLPEPPAEALASGQSAASLCPAPVAVLEFQGEELGALPPQQQGEAEDLLPPAKMLPSGQSTTIWSASAFMGEQAAGLTTSRRPGGPGEDMGFDSPQQPSGIKGGDSQSHSPAAVLHPGRGSVGLTPQPSSFIQGGGTVSLPPQQPSCIQGVELGVLPPQPQSDIPESKFTGFPQQQLTEAVKMEQTLRDHGPTNSGTDRVKIRCLVSLLLRGEICDEGFRVWGSFRSLDVLAGPSQTGLPPQHRPPAGIT